MEKGEEKKYQRTYQQHWLAYPEWAELELEFVYCTLVHKCRMQRKWSKKQGCSRFHMIAAEILLANG